MLVKKKDIARMYQGLPTLADRLPWRDFNEENKCILLEDNKSLGAVFKLTPIPCEARSNSMLQEIAKSISDAIKNSIPCEKNTPWILQLYAYKEPNLSSVYKEIENYISDKRKLSPITQAYLDNLREHFEYVSKSGGVFHDSQVTNSQFRGGLLYVYAVIYKHEDNNSKNYSRYKSLEEILRISQKLTDQLRLCGMGVECLSGEGFYRWMSQWFNPKNQYATSYVKNTKQTIDLAEQLFFHTPASFEQGWFFDGLPHKVITIQYMTVAPSIGHITAERNRATEDKVFNLIDQLPEGTVFTIAIVLQAPSEVELHLKTIQGSAVGGHPQAVKVKEEIAIAEKLIADGDPLFPVVMAVYIRGNSIENLCANEAQAEVLLNSNGFKVITDDELFPIDAYLRYLPMCYDFHFDHQYAQRYRYMSLSDIAKLAPFYGRSRGTHHPGIVMFNRGGEPWFYDLMVDKTKNAHFLLLGESGTGKSNLLNYLIMQDLALYNSRFFIIDAGGSFDLLGDYCQSLGLIVRKIKIDPKNPVSLNPFAYGLRVIEQVESLHGQSLEAECDKLIEERMNNHNSDAVDDMPRDILGDMVLAALLMITGGEKREEETIRRSDRMLIMDAIINAAYFVRKQNRDQMIANDIVEAFERIAQELDYSRHAEKIRRAREMADSMRYFTNDPVSSRFFNSYGTPWEQADLTIVDFGLFANEGYEAQRSIAFAGCMNKILALAEINQHSDRSIKLVLDENHIFTSIPLLADIETRIAKMGRKLGLWLWIATQNLKDFAANSRRMLAQIEHWICLSLPPDEINQIQDFKVLTEIERLFLLSARKDKGKFTEGTFISPTTKALFRHVAPALYLAMAATDQDEKNLRARMMLEHHCSEIEAVKLIAKQMMEKER